MRLIGLRFWMGELEKESFVGLSVDGKGSWTFSG